MCSIQATLPSMRKSTSVMVALDGFGVATHRIRDGSVVMPSSVDVTLNFAPAGPLPDEAVDAPAPVPMASTESALISAAAKADDTPLRRRISPSPSPEHRAIGATAVS